MTQRMLALLGGLRAGVGGAAVASLLSPCWHGKDLVVQIGAQACVGTPIAGSPRVASDATLPVPSARGARNYSDATSTRGDAVNRFTDQTKPFFSTSGLAESAAAAAAGGLSASKVSATLHGWAHLLPMGRWLLAFLAGKKTLLGIKLLGVKKLLLVKPLLKALVVVGGVAIVWWFAREEVPYTGRWHANVLPVDVERDVGQRARQEAVGEMLREGGAVLRPEVSPCAAAVTRIGHQLVEAVQADPAVQPLCGHLEGMDWAFLTVQQDALQAFSMLGGTVVVSTGMLDMLDGSAADSSMLTAVLAHEVAHVVARHHAESGTQRALISLLLAGLLRELDLAIPQFLAQLAMELPTSRELELEADFIALAILDRCGVPPEALRDALQRLQPHEAARGWDGGRLCQTHPPMEDRIAQIDCHLQQQRQRHHSLAGAAERGTVPSSSSG